MLNFHESYYYIIRKINDIFMIIFLQSSLHGKNLVSQKVQTIIYGTFHGPDLPDCPILVGYTNYTATHAPLPVATEMFLCPQVAACQHHTQ